MNTTATTAAVLTIAPVSARRLANAAKRRDGGRAAAILAKAISGAVIDEEVTFEIDKYDRKVRLTKASDAEIADALHGNRVIDSIEIVELLGNDAFTKLVSNGSLKRDVSHSKYRINNLYWITTKAADIYGVPATFTQKTSGATVSLVEA